MSPASHLAQLPGGFRDRRRAYAGCLLSRKTRCQYEAMVTARLLHSSMLAVMRIS
jgi:hypothetical protein